MMFRIASFLVWAVVAAAAVFWTLRLAVIPPTAQAYASVDQGFSSAGGDFSRLLGTTPEVLESEFVVAAPPLAASRFQLKGVVAPWSANSSEGLALISVDGRPAKHFSVGTKIDADWVLQSVSRRSVSIGPPQGNAVAVLELPALSAPATGTLTAAPFR